MSINGLSYWDNQFRFSSLISDFQCQINDMINLSDDFSKGRLFDRFFYGSHDRQWFEVMEGSSDSDIVTVFIHGGYWRALDAESHRFVLNGLGKIGRSSVNVEYRLMPEFSMQDLVSDVRCAFESILAKFETNVRFLFVGHSAGAHLAALALETLSVEDKDFSFVSIGGIFDLEPISLSFLQQEICLSVKDINKYSMVKYGLTHDIRSLFVVGELETNEFQRQAELMAYKSNGQLYRVPETNHMTILKELYNSKSELIQLIKSN